MKTLVIAVLVLTFLITWSCNSDRELGSDAPNPNDSLALSNDSIKLVDTASAILDTATNPVGIDPDTTGPSIIVSPPLQEDKRYGVLGYSYFKAMRQNETRNINAYVTIINSETKVIDTLREINSEILPERRNDTSSIFTQNIILYKYIDIRLIDPDNDFGIKQIHDSSRQEIDSLAGNFWSWAITPKTKKAHSRLILRVVAEKPDGTHQPFQAKNIPININLDSGIFRSLYIWLFENPEKLLVLILIPLVAFFWKQIAALFGRKPKSK